MEDTWYVATLIIQCRVEGLEARLKTVDEQIRVLLAPNTETAYAKAIQLGKEQEVSYKNMYDVDVYWEFLGLADLEELAFDSEISDGTEIRSRLLRRKVPSKLVVPQEELTVFAWERERLQQSHLERQTRES